MSGIGLGIPPRMRKAALPSQLADLRIGHVIANVGELLGLGILRPNTLRAAKIRDARVRGDAGPSQHHDTLGLFNPLAGSLHVFVHIRISMTGCSFMLRQYSAASSRVKSVRMILLCLACEIGRASCRERVSSL